VCDEKRWLGDDPPPRGEEVAPGELERGTGRVKDGVADVDTVRIRGDDEEAEDVEK